MPNEQQGYVVDSYCFANKMFCDCHVYLNGVCVGPSRMPGWFMIEKYTLKTAQEVHEPQCCGSPEVHCRMSIAVAQWRWWLT